MIHCKHHWRTDHQSLNPEALWFFTLTMISCRANRCRFCGLQTSSNCPLNFVQWPLKRAPFSEHCIMGYSKLVPRALSTFKSKMAAHAVHRKLGFLLNLKAWHRKVFRHQLKKSITIPINYSYRVKTVYFWEAWNAWYCLWRSLWQVIVISLSSNLCVPKGTLTVL